MSSGPQSRNERFDTLDWESVNADGGGVGWHVRTFVVGFGLLAVGYLYDRFGPGGLPVVSAFSWLDWLTALALLALVAFVAIPLARNRQTTSRYWSRFRTNWLGVASLCYLLAFFVVGLLAPLVVSPPELSILHSYQPPVWLSVDTIHVTSCVGQVTNGRCHGTWQYPLGTTSTGKSVVPYVILGARSTLQVALVSAALLVPTGVAVGFAAAYAGSRVDALLMRLAEILQTLPAFLIYLVLRPWVTDHRLFLMVAVFGLVSWGGLARLVRNEALELREQQYVQAARTIGADERTIARRHLLPNVSGAVLTNATLQVPMLILTEAALSFLGLGDPEVFSWGQTIALGIKDFGISPAWWITAAPAVLLTATVLAFNVFGDALETVLDPEGGE